LPALSAMKRTTAEGRLPPTKSKIRSTSSGCKKMVKGSIVSNATG
jgi:hypothetical protein